MFTANVAAIPAPRSHRDNAGASSRCRAASRSTIDAAMIRPSMTTGYRCPISPGSPWTVTIITACR
jgi:hypothetical protein